MIRRVFTMLAVAIALLCGATAGAQTTTTGSTTQPTSPGQTTTSTTTTTGPVFYADCEAAAQAGAQFPLLPGQPGWRIGLDGEGNVPQCENFQGTTTTAFTPSTTSTSTTVASTTSSSTTSSTATTSTTETTQNLAQQQFPNCAAAAAAGRTNISSTDPAYAPALDRDGDGIGCETDGVEAPQIGGIAVTPGSTQLPPTGGTLFWVTLGLAACAAGGSCVVAVRRRPRPALS